MRKKDLSPRNYVAFWFNKYSQNNPLNDSYFDSVFLDFREDCTALKWKGAPKDELKSAYDEFVKGYPDRQLKSFNETIDGLLEDLEPLKNWLTATTGTANELDLAVMAHWLWCTKRKAQKRPAVWHIMPVLKGAQGGGKTQALQKLLRPLNDFVLKTHLDKIGDQNLYKAFSEKLVIFCDELQGADKADLNTLKNLITTETTSYRIMYTQTTRNAPMLCSFIGATNRSISEQFFDSSGMRRFYQLECLPKLDHAAINGLDATAIWRGIDANKERGYLDGAVLEALLNKQDDYVRREDLDTFLDEYNLQPATELSYKEMSHQHIYDMYRAWCSRTGSKDMGANNLNHKLTLRGFSFTVARNDVGGRIKLFKVLDNRESKTAPLLAIGVKK